MNQTISYYDEHAKEYCESTINADMGFCQRRFLPLLPQGGHILDAGCGSGRDSKIFLDNGYKVTAMDASQQMCKEAEKLLGQQVLHLSFEEMEFENEFDGIWACASLLHVPKSDMGMVMQKLKKALKPGGVLYASFKSGTQERISGGRFYNDYLEDDLSAILKENNFDIYAVFFTKDVMNRQSEGWVNAYALKKETE